MVPEQFLTMVQGVAPSWQSVLGDGLQAMAGADPNYLPALIASDFLPTNARLFAAFSQPLECVRYVLVGEGPYPRADSATGVCFMDGAVGNLWSVNGLSKSVNRATSLRNFMKMLLVAAGDLETQHTTGDALTEIAARAQALDSSMIQTLGQLQNNLTANGFLLLNASLAFRAHVPPMQEARGWRPFLQTVLTAMAQQAQTQTQTLPTLVLWGKVAAQIDALEVAKVFPKVIAEHPYNLSFINNSSMHALFGPMTLLKASVR